MTTELEQGLRQALQILAAPRQEFSLVDLEESYDESHRVEEALEHAIICMIPNLPDLTLQSLAWDLVEQSRQARGSYSVSSTLYAGQIKDEESLLAWRPTFEQAEQLANYCYEAGVPASVHGILVDVERSVYPRTHPRYRQGTHTEETRYGVFVLKEHLYDEIVERIKAALFGLREKTPPLVSLYAISWNLPQTQEQFYYTSRTYEQHSA